LILSASNCVSAKYSRSVAHCASAMSDMLHLGHCQSENVLLCYARRHDETRACRLIRHGFLRHSDGFSRTLPLELTHGKRLRRNMDGDTLAYPYFYYG
jgi:hypothetical protein